MELSFKTKNPKQLQAAKYWIDSTTEEILYGGGKGGGKSFLGCSLIFGDALIYPETHYFIARGELTDLRKFTIPSIHEVFKNWGIKLDDYATFNGQDNCYTLTNGSKVYLLSCKEIPSDTLYERFGSMQMTRGWIEEGGEVSERAKANLWLSVGRWKNDIYKLKKKLLVTANPKKGWMKSDFVVPFKENRLPITKKYIQALATDNKYLPEDYINTLRNEKDTVRRQRLFEGDWDYDESKDSLLRDNALSDAFSNTITTSMEKYLIVDVARLGKDCTTFEYWQGLSLYRIEKFNKQDTEVTKQKIKDTAAIEKIPWSNIMVDEDGIGGAIVDGMLGIRGFVANSSPMQTKAQIRSKSYGIIENELIPKPNFTNLKSQCGYKLAELINEHKISFAVPEYREEIMEDVSSLLRAKNIDSDGKLQLRPKDLVKEELGRSPDVGDPIIYRMWFELKRESYDLNPDKLASTKRIQETFTRMTWEAENPSNGTM